METTMLIQMTPENLATIVEEAVKKSTSNTESQWKVRRVLDY